VKYSFAFLTTLGANQIVDKSVGIAIMAKDPSTTFNAKSKDVTENIPTKIMKIY
jgi:hypothetical protein